MRPGGPSGLFFNPFHTMHSPSCPISCSLAEFKDGKEEWAVITGLLSPSRDGCGGGLQSQYPARIALFPLLMGAEEEEETRQEAHRAPSWLPLVSAPVLGVGATRCYAF